jgi:hypothetical protein
MLPHQREKPDPTLPDTEIRWGERHLRIEWGIGSLWMILSRPSEGLAFPRLPLGMKAGGKGPDGIEVRYGHLSGHHQRFLRPTREFNQDEMKFRIQVILSGFVHHPQISFLDRRLVGEHLIELPLFQIFAPLFDAKRKLEFQALFHGVSPETD